MIRQKWAIIPSRHRSTSASAMRAPIVSPVLDISGLPVFTLTCTQGPLAGRTCMVTDPGRAMISGKCKGIGRLKGPILRGACFTGPVFSQRFNCNSLGRVEILRSTVWDWLHRSAEGRSGEFCKLTLRPPLMLCAPAQQSARTLRAVPGKNLEWDCRSDENSLNKSAWSTCRCRIMVGGPAWHRDRFSQYHALHRGIFRRNRRKRMRRCDIKVSSLR